MKSRAILLLIGLLVANRIIAQTTIPLAGACTDCAAVITAFNNCSVASAGTLKAGTVVGTGVTQTIQLTVGKVGKYNLSTTNNGITFAASGTFTTLGLQTVVLTATGYAISGGVTTFTLSSNGQSCSFNRTVGGATTLITGPCPSNLKYKEVLSRFCSGLNGERSGGFGLSKDSVVYSLPGVIYGKSAIGNIEDLEVPIALTISPMKMQNIPKVVTMCTAGVGYPYFVGVDGYIYAIRCTVGADEKYSNPGFTYPYTYVGLPSAYDEYVAVVKFPLPPTGTKWVDVTAGKWSYLYGLTDSGEIYAIPTEAYQNGMETPFVKIPIPLNTSASTFKYTKFQNKAKSYNNKFVMVKGNDTNYYTFSIDGGGGFYHFFGWGTELTDPNSDFTFARYPTVSSQIRKVAFPAGTVLADGSDSFTEDGRKFVWGAIGTYMYQIVTGPTNLFHFYYPLKDGDYSLSRADIKVFGGLNNDYNAFCTTPREVALPSGATKFVSQEFTISVAQVAWRTTVAGITATKGSTPFIALTDNGSYGNLPAPINYPPWLNELTYMEEAAGLTSPAGGKIYFPKYVPSGSDFAPFHIPFNAYGLGLDGTAYQTIAGAGGISASPGSVLMPRYTPLTNGRCDFNNAYPEP